MKSNRDGKHENETSVELKYCERCGGLGVRAARSGVYCKSCLPEIAELPAPRDPGKTPEADDAVPGQADFEYEIFDFDAIEFEATGGAA